MQSNPPAPISRDELVRDLTTVHPLPKSKVREMIDAYVAQEVRRSVIAEIQMIKRETFGDRVTAEQMKQVMSEHLGRLFSDSEVTEENLGNLSSGEADNEA